MLELSVQKLEPERLLSFTWHPYAVDSAVDYSKEEPTLVEFKLEKAGGGYACILKKAFTIAKLTGKMTMSDDSGIEVAVLGNAPGIYSARFAGEGSSDRQRNQKLFQMLGRVPAETVH